MKTVRYVLAWGGGGGKYFDPERFGCLLGKFHIWYTAGENTADVLYSRRALYKKRAGVPSPPLPWYPYVENVILPPEQRIGEVNYFYVEPLTPGTLIKDDAPCILADREADTG